MSTLHFQLFVEIDLHFFAFVGRIIKNSTAVTI